jgi:hypothetical protein
MMKQALMRTALGKEDAVTSAADDKLELTAPQISAQINPSQSSSNRHLNINCSEETLNQVFVV